MKKSTVSMGVTAFVLVLAFLLPSLGVRSYYLHIAILSLLNALLAMGVNFIAGYAGQLSLAQAAFFGIGSYAASLAVLKLHVSFWLALPIGVLASVLVAVVFGLPTLRLKGPYFVISTLGFGEIVRLVFLNWETLTRGPNGLAIEGPVPLSLGFTVWELDSKAGFYYLTLLALVVALFFCVNMVHSRVGRALRAIHTDQIAAEAMGVNLTFYKVFAFAWGAALSGLAGGLYAGYVRFISPDTFTIGESVNILIMAVLGGMGTISGPVVGAVIITFLLETMRMFADYRMVIYGLLMFVMILYMPEGIAGWAADKWRGRRVDPAEDKLACETAKTGWKEA